MSNHEIDIDDLEWPDSVKQKLELWDKAMDGDTDALIKLSELRGLYNTSESIV